MISSHLFRRLLRSSLAFSHRFFSDAYLHGKGFIVIRSLFSQQMIRDLSCKISLHHFLKDGLAIEKEFFMFYII